MLNGETPYDYCVVKFGEVNMIPFNELSCNPCTVSSSFVEVENHNQLWHSPMDLVKESTTINPSKARLFPYDASFINASFINKINYPIPRSNIFNDHLFTQDYNRETSFQGIRQRRRILFTSFQIRSMEKKYQTQSYLSATEREQLASEINLTSNQVKIWFQNHRYKCKRIERDFNYFRPRKTF